MCRSSQPAVQTECQNRIEGRFVDFQSQCPRCKNRKVLTFRKCTSPAFLLCNSHPNLQMKPEVNKKINCQSYIHVLQHTFCFSMWYSSQDAIGNLSGLNPHLCSGSLGRLLQLSSSLFKTILVIFQALSLHLFVCKVSKRIITLLCSMQSTL